MIPISVSRTTRMKRETESVGSSGRLVLMTGNNTKVMTKESPALTRIGTALPPNIGVAANMPATRPITSVKKENSPRVAKGPGDSTISVSWWRSGNRSLW
ncbi:hypothetical protein OR1_01963 [Geobacter sp. OR-1]|nr:hypothetical protein OR1_01963 [Geobacter sp. OR-1]